MRLWPAIAAVAALSIIACGRAGSGSPPIATPPTSALVPWKAFPAGQVPRPVVLLGNFSPSSYSSGDGKIAAMCNKFTSATKLSTVVPPQAQATWTTGTRATYPAISAAAAFTAVTQPPAQSMPDCATVAPLVVSGARFGIFEFVTDRGKAQISAWLFAVSGTGGEIAYPAIAAPSIWNADLRYGSLDRGTTISADGRLLTFGFYGAPSSDGPCGAEYKALVAEALNAVAVAIQMIPNASPGDMVACPAIAQERSVTVALASPLGGRVVVDRDGNAVGVCPAAFARDC
jgi:hypothetical protein